MDGIASTHGPLQTSVITTDDDNMYVDVVHYLPLQASSIENVGTLNAPGSISVPGDSRATVAAQPRNSTQSFAGGFGHFLTEISAT